MHQSTATWQLGGRSILVSHLEKLYWPESGVTKGDLLRYYRSVAPVLLPYLQDRSTTGIIQRIQETQAVPAALAKDGSDARDR